IGGVEVQHAIGLAVPDRAQHDRFSLESAGHGGKYTLIGMADENGNVFLYTTEPCGFCQQGRTAAHTRGTHAASSGRRRRCCRRAVWTTARSTSRRTPWAAPSWWP